MRVRVWEQKQQPGALDLAPASVDQHGKETDCKKREVGCNKFGNPEIWVAAGGRGSFILPEHRRFQKMWKQWVGYLWSMKNLSFGNYIPLLGMLAVLDKCPQTNKQVKVCVLVKYPNNLLHSVFLICSSIHLFNSVYC